MSRYLAHGQASSKAPIASDDHYTVLEGRSLDPPADPARSFTAANAAASVTAQALASKQGRRLAPRTLCSERA
jgi:hypothetical protein